VIEYIETSTRVPTNQNKVNRWPSARTIFPRERRW